MKNVDDFIKRIKNESQLDIPKDYRITLHGPAGTAIIVGDPISSLAPGNSFTNPLHVQVSDAAKPASNAELTSFWNSLRQMLADDGFLHLPLVTDLIEDDTSTIYIRESYKDLFNIIWNNVNPEVPNPRRHRIAITGTPGIGKSMFLFYIIWRLANMKTKRTVILRRQMDEGDIYVFQDEGCWVATRRRDIRLLLKDETTWYLTDALEPQPGKVKAVTIVVSSPARKYYSTFLTYSHVAPLYYLPFWSLEELQLVACFYSKSPEIVEKRFNMIGGVIRYVLEQDISLERHIKSSFSRLEKHNYSRLISNQMVNDGQGHTFDYTL